VVCDVLLLLLQIRSGDCVSTLPAHSDPVTSVSFNRDGTVVCSASHDGLIRLWDVATGECLKTIYATGNPPVCSAKFSPNSHYILGATLLDATLRLWPVHRTGSNQCAKTYQCPEYHTNTKFSIVSDFTCHGDIVTGSETGHGTYHHYSNDVCQCKAAATDIRHCHS
jgi:COMPASS component SWD3